MILQSTIDPDNPDQHSLLTRYVSEYEVLGPTKWRFFTNNDEKKIKKAVKTALYKKNRFKAFFTDDINEKGTIG